MSESEIEIWLPIAGFEDYYEVSNLGRVRSLDRVITLREHPKQKTRKFKGQILRPAICGSKKKKYLGVGLWAGDSHSAMVHRLVASAFIPNPLNLPQVNHIDGDKFNNKASNLEWCTALENTRHAIETGLFNQYGDGSVNAKLTNEQAVAIRELHAKGGYSYPKLAEMFNVHTVSIGRIVRRERYVTA